MTLGSSVAWLTRFARYKGIGALEGPRPELSLKPLFSQAGWRVVCRSPRTAFCPILRNPLLGFADLIRYVQVLADHGFRVAPPGKVLGVFVAPSSLSLDELPEVPTTPEDMAVLRLASQKGRIRRNQLHGIRQWLQAGHKIAPRMNLDAVFRRVSIWQAQQRARLLAQACTASWPFACDSTPWFGLEIVPMSTALDLWEDGQAMSTCLYSLRAECDSDTATRFFSVRKGGRRHATLELIWSYQPTACNPGGTYRIRDCRLSANRLPSLELVNLLTLFAAHYSLLVASNGLSPNRKASTKVGVWLPFDWGRPP